MNASDSCSLCGHRNPVTNRFCGRCGASLTAGEQLVSRREESSAVAKGSLPTKLKPIGKAVGKTIAASVAVLVAEATLAWLQHRGGIHTRAAHRPSLPTARSGTGAQQGGHLIGQSLEEVFVRVRADDRGELFVHRAAGVFRVSESPKEYR